MGQELTRSPRGLAVALLLVGVLAQPLQAHDEAKPESGQDTAEQEQATAGAADSNPPENRAPLLPEIDIYVPEGRLDLRLGRIVKNAFFEGQLKYDFVGGDISAFLRYRYYGYKMIYQLGLFDSVEFSDLGELDNDFERVRGLLFLTEIPHSYHYRTFFLAEVDRLQTNKQELRFSNERTNAFVRLGFQRGTPDDGRSNSIVGESRARVENLFSAHRKIGPSQTGFTAALTYSLGFAGSDFDYLKAEFEALKRFDLSPEVFVVARAHGGSFLTKEKVRQDGDLLLQDQYSIPRSELFRLDGRENLKGIDDDIFGTDEFHATVELFVPWFIERSRKFLGLEWETFYWVFYGGAGTAGFDSDVFTDFDEYFPDVGVGFEASFKLRDYTFFLGTIIAQAVRDGNDIETHVVLKSYH